MSNTLNKTRTKAGITYNSLHWWIRRELGSALKCENPNCDKKSKWFVWAKLKGKNYDKKSENFWQLCRKCHFNYDMTQVWRKKFVDEGRKKAQKARIGMHHSTESKLKIALSLKGRKVWNKGKSWSLETKKKMSLARMGKIPWNKGIKTKWLGKS